MLQLYQGIISRDESSYGRIGTVFFLDLIFRIDPFLKASSIKASSIESVGYRRQG